MTLEDEINVYYVKKDKNNPIIIPKDMNPIGTGDEGVVYNVGGIAVKILNDFSWMTENKIWTLSQIVPPKLIMMPMQPIYDKDDKYSGYVMKLSDCINAKEANLDLMACKDLITSIKFIDSDAKLLAEQKIALIDTTLRNAVINNSNNLVNVIDPDRYLTSDDPKCNFRNIKEFKATNNYWVNRLWESIFYEMIEQSTNFPGAEFRKFRFYMREELADAMKGLYVPSFIKDEVKGSETVREYMTRKHQLVKSRGLLSKY